MKEAKRNPYKVEVEGAEKVWFTRAGEVRVGRMYLLALAKFSVGMSILYFL